MVAEWLCWSYFGSKQQCNAGPPATPATSNQKSNISQFIVFCELDFGLCLGGVWQLCNTQICIHNSLAGCRAILCCGPITFQTDTRCSHSCVVICLEKGVNYCLCFILLDLGNAVLCNSKFWVSFRKVLISSFTYLLCLHTKEHRQWVK